VYVLDAGVGAGDLINDDLLAVIRRGDLIGVHSDVDRVVIAIGAQTSDLRNHTLVAAVQTDIFAVDGNSRISISNQLLLSGHGLQRVDVVGLVQGVGIPGEGAD